MGLPVSIYSPYLGGGFISNLADGVLNHHCEYFNVWVITWKEIHTTLVVTALKNELCAVLRRVYIYLLQVVFLSEERSLDTQCEIRKGCISDCLSFNCQFFLLPVTRQLSADCAG